jgi:hypothetical protein
MASIGIAALIASGTAAAVVRLATVWRRQVGGRRWDADVAA